MASRRAGVKRAFAWRRRNRNGKPPHGREGGTMRTTHRSTDHGSYGISAWKHSRPTRSLDTSRAEQA